MTCSKKHMAYLLIASMMLAACSSGGGGGGGGGGDMMPPRMDMQEPSGPDVCSQAYIDEGGDDGACIRSLVPGAARFWQERRRIPAGTTSRLRIIDNNPNHHASWVHNVAQRIAFVDVPDPAVTNLLPTGSGVSQRYSELDGESPGYVVSISLFPLFADNSVRREGEELATTLIETKGSVLVAAAGNNGGQLTHARTGGEEAIATGLVLFVSGLDYEMLKEGVYVRSRGSSFCAWGKAYCVMASFTTPIPGDSINYTGTSFATPMVSSSLANARLLWPDMTSQQTVNLARYCARPINDDGTLAPYGTILSDDEASEDWGQGVFSVECLFDANGALFNPITRQSPATNAVRTGAPLSGRRLRGRLSLTGTKSHLTLTDIFSRTFSFSRHVDRPELSFAPENISGLYGTQDGVFGLIWKNIGAAMKIEDNDFFGSYGTGDFKFGDTMIIMLQLGHEFQMSQWLHFSLHAQSAWGQMQSARGSAISDAEGHTHQLQAGISYRQNRLKASIAARYNFGVRGKIELAEFGALKLAPRSETIAQAHISLSF